MISEIAGCKKKQWAYNVRISFMPFNDATRTPSNGSRDVSRVRESPVSSDVGIFTREGKTNYWVARLQLNTDFPEPSKSHSIA